MLCSDSKVFFLVGRKVLLIHERTSSPRHRMDGGSGRQSLGSPQCVAPSVSLPVRQWEQTGFQPMACGKGDCMSPSDAVTLSKAPSHQAEWEACSRLVWRKQRAVLCMSLEGATWWGTVGTTRAWRWPSVVYVVGGKWVLPTTWMSSEGILS